MEGLDVSAELEELKRRQEEQKQQIEDLEDITNKLQIDQLAWQKYSEQRFTQQESQYKDIIDQMRVLKKDVNMGIKEAIAAVGATNPVWVTGMLAVAGVGVGVLVAISIAHGWL